MAADNGHGSEEMERIQALLDTEDWEGARQLILERLARAGVHHRLIALLALTCYEQARYEEALELAKDAVQLAPKCPLALWLHAAALDVTLREDQAIEAFERVTQGEWDMAEHGDCLDELGGIDFLVGDTHRRLADCYRDLGELEQAAALYAGALQVLPEDTDEAEEARASLSEIQVNEGRQPWIGGVDLIPRPGVDFQEGAAGATCWVLCLARDERDYRRLVEEEFGAEGLEVEAIEDLERLSRVLKQYDLSDELMELSKDLSPASPIQYRTINVYQSRDGEE